MRTLLGRIFLVIGFPFHHFKYILPLPLACRVSAEKSTDNLMGIPLYTICCFSLAAFNIFSSCLIFVSLINMFLLCGTLYFGYYFLSHVREVFDHNLFKYFLRPFVLLFFWDPYNSNVGMFNIVSEVSETVLISFHSFFFILLPGSYFHHSVFQLTCLFFFLSYYVIDSF